MEEGNDCDDLDATAFPDAVEVCDGIDNDCDGDADGELTQRWWADADEDGLGESGEGVVRRCDEGAPGPGPWVTNNLDCDDMDGAAGLPSQWWIDRDDDGRGDPTEPTVSACSEPAGDWSRNSRDCDDADSRVHEDAAEVCDGIDNDCDARTQIDEGTTCGTDGVPWFDATHGNYIFIDSPFDYAGAETICGSFNYRLVHVESGAEEAAIASEAAALGWADNQFWLGASSECITPVDTQWAWEDPVAGDCDLFTAYALGRASISVNFRLATASSASAAWEQYGGGSLLRVVCELP